MSNYSKERYALTRLQLMDNYHTEEWLKVAEKCVLKQIPQPVIIERSMEGGILVDYAMICPTCKCDLFECMNYCQECGQLLDWHFEED